MASERTLSIIKPDAVSANRIGKVIACLEEAGLKITAQRMIRLDTETAGRFYSEHSDRPFFKDLVQFMTSGPIVVQVLEGEGAIARNRQIMGATNPENADPGTIRAAFAADTMRNAVHGSDSSASAAREVAFFFTEDDIQEAPDA